MEKKERMTKTKVGRRVRVHVPEYKSNGVYPDRPARTYEGEVIAFKSGGGAGPHRFRASYTLREDDGTVESFYTSTPYELL